MGKLYIGPVAGQLDSRQHAPVSIGLFMSLESYRIEQQEFQLE